MKIGQIIYKNHLLPPFIKPFHGISSYLETIHPQIYNTIKNLKDDLKNQQIELKRYQFLNFNSTVMQQLNTYKFKYMEPLRNCPNYYQLLHQRVIQQIGQDYINKTYQHVYKRINKQKIYNQFILKYIQFKRQVKQPYIKQHNFIPICLFTSPQQLAISYQKQWATLGDQEQIAFQNRFVQFIQNYHKELKQCALEYKITLEMLLKMMKDQMDSNLDKEIKQILLQF